jgi:serine/threonine protein kinase
MGLVYKARQTALNRTVAIKMILDPDAVGPEYVVRFRVEAEAAARIQHPNIVTVHEVGTAAGRPFLCLEYVEGGSLESRLTPALGAPRWSAGVVETLARAMHFAHTRGVVHRDLKPANSHLPQGPGARAVAPVPDRRRPGRRPAAVPGGPAHPRPAGRAGGAAGEVVPAPAPSTVWRSAGTGGSRRRPPKTGRSGCWNSSRSGNWRSSAGTPGR